MADSCLRVLIAWHPDSANQEIVDAVAWLQQSTPLTIRAMCGFIRPWPRSPLSKLGRKSRTWLEEQESNYHTVVTTALADAGVEATALDATPSVFAEGSSESSLLTQGAEEFSADAIVVGPAYSSPHGRYLAGSTADSLLHDSPVPLVLVPRAVKLGKKGVARVSCALTTDRDHAEVTERAAQMAERCGASLRIIAFNPNHMGSSLAPTSSSLDSLLANDAREHALANLDRARDAISRRHPDLSVKTTFATGGTWGQAMAAVKWKKSDLLVVGSEPTHPLARVFIGSHASAILRHSQVPVVIIPSSDVV